MYDLSQLPCRVIIAACVMTIAACHADLDGNARESDESQAAQVRRKIKADSNREATPTEAGAWVSVRGERLPLDASVHDVSTRDGRRELAFDASDLIRARVEDRAIQTQLSPDQRRSLWRRIATMVSEDPESRPHSERITELVTQVRAVLEGIRESRDEGGHELGSASPSADGVWIRPPRSLTPSESELASHYPTRESLSARIDELDFLLEHGIGHVYIEEITIALIMAGVALCGENLLEVPEATRQSIRQEVEAYMDVKPGDEWYDEWVAEGECAYVYGEADVCLWRHMLDMAERGEITMSPPWLHKAVVRSWKLNISFNEHLD